MNTNSEKHLTACTYPGTLDEAKVEAALQHYLDALNISRKIVRLRRDWLLEDHVGLCDYVQNVLSDIRKSMGQGGKDLNPSKSEMQKLAVWSISLSSQWYSFDLSWLSIYALGAEEKKLPSVSVWADPVLDAFCSGAWFLHWTESTVYWCAKPTLHYASATDRRLHRPDGPAVVSDFTDIYYLHGVVVPEYVVMHPEMITIENIKATRNIEVRRVMIERMGIAKYVLASKFKIIDTATENHPVVGLRHARLLQTAATETHEDPLTIVECVNSSPEPDGSFRTYHLSVNPSHYNGEAGRNVWAAMASTWRDADNQNVLYFKDWREYQPIIET